MSVYAMKALPSKGEHLGRFCLPLPSHSDYCLFRVDQFNFFLWLDSLSIAEAGMAPNLGPRHLHQRLMYFCST